jgi:hypothetical protein
MRHFAPRGDDLVEGEGLGCAVGVLPPMPYPKPAAKRSPRPARVEGFEGSTMACYPMNRTSLCSPRSKSSCQ